MIVAPTPLTPEIYVFTALIMIMGSITVFLSGFIAWIFFARGKRFEHPSLKKIASSIGWQLIGTLILGAGALVFAFAAHFGLTAQWDPPVRSAIRAIMFTASALSTIHLFNTLRKIM